MIFIEVVLPKVDVSFRLKVRLSGIPCILQLYGAQC